jgi:hypothetical protein
MLCKPITFVVDAAKSKFMGRKIYGTMILLTTLSCIQKKAPIKLGAIEYRIVTCLVSGTTIPAFS